MAVRIRLLRMGRKKKPFYRIVVMDSRTRRDGRYLDKIGHYNPIAKPAEIVIDKDKVLSWLEKGAVPSQTVFNLLQKEGIALEWHLIRNKVGEQVRNVELQKWVLAKKERDSKKSEKISEKVETQVEDIEEAVKEEPVEDKVKTISEEPVVETSDQTVAGAPEEEKPEQTEAPKDEDKKDKAQN